jgi:CubicO group peptidase (beta-lactamase class C family)
MGSTGWFAWEFGSRPFAASFVAPNSPASFGFGVSPYAIGNLRSSVNDLARFMIMWTNDGVAFGTRLLAPGTVAAATTYTPTNARAGFYWHRRSAAERPEIWNHDGSIEGVCTRMDIDPIKQDGFVILTNGPCDQAYPHIDAIEYRVLRTLDTLP